MFVPWAPVLVGAPIATMLSNAGAIVTSVILKQEIQQVKLEGLIFLPLQLVFIT